MAFLTKLVNVGSNLDDLDRAIRKGEIRVVKPLLKKINNYFLYMEDAHKRSLHPNEIAQLEKVRRIIAEAEAVVNSLGDLKKKLTELRKQLGIPFTVSSVYLLRHPEKPKKGGSSKKQTIGIAFVVIVVLVFALYFYSGILEANPKMRGLEHESYCMVWKPEKESLEREKNITIEKLRIYDCDGRGFCCVSYEYKELP